jgi:hypothetical protein
VLGRVNQVGKAGCAPACTFMVEVLLHLLWNGGCSCCLCG